MPATDIVRITDTLQYTSKAFAFSKKTTEDYLQQEIGYIISIIKDPPKILPLFSNGDATKNVINHISHTLQQSTDQPRLQILPLSPMLPQSQNQNLLPPKIANTPAPDMRLEPVVQPLRLQTFMKSSTSPPRVKPSKSPI